MNQINRVSRIACISALLLVSLTGCVDVDPYSTGGSGGYRDPYYGDYRYDDRSRRRSWDEQRDLRHERRELERERDRTEAERRRFEEEKARRDHEAREAERRRSQERCPSGYSPSENKCSPEERRRGCSDIRLSNGMGCVRR